MNLFTGEKKVNSPGRSDWVPVVCVVSGGGFALTQQFRDVIGPIWGRMWKAKAFVAHIISHFDDPLEHLLDCCPDGNEDAFDVDPEWCDIIARKYKDQFLNLPGEWYRAMFRAKLQSLCLPVKIIEDAKWAYLQKYHDHKAVIMGFVDMAQNRRYVLPDGLLSLTRNLSNMPAVEAWEGFEQVLHNLLEAGAITTADISELLMTYDRQD